MDGQSVPGARLVRPKGDSQTAPRPWTFSESFSVGSEKWLISARRSHVFQATTVHQSADSEGDNPSSDGLGAMSGLVVGMPAVSLRSLGKPGPPRLGKCGTRLGKHGTRLGKRGKRLGTRARSSDAGCIGWSCHADS